MDEQEREEFAEQVKACAHQIAMTVFKAADSSKVGLCAAVFVAAGCSRAMGIERADAMEMFAGFYDDATDFMGDIHEQHH